MTCCCVASSRERRYKKLRSSSGQRSVRRGALTSSNICAPPPPPPTTATPGRLLPGRPHTMSICVIKGRAFKLEGSSSDEHDLPKARPLENDPLPTQCGPTTNITMDSLAKELRKHEQACPMSQSRRELPESTSRALLPADRARPPAAREQSDKHMHPPARKLPAACGLPARPAKAPAAAARRPYAHEDSAVRYEDPPPRPPSTSIASRASRRPVDETGELFDDIRHEARHRERKKASAKTTPRRKTAQNSRMAVPHTLLLSNNK